MTKRHAVAAAVLALMASCAGPRVVLNTPASSCFRAIPAARAAVHGRGKLIGVRRLTARAAARRLPELAPTSADVCVFAYRGPFTRSAVDMAVQQRGEYALVAVNTKTWTEIGAVLRDVLRTRFRHRV